MDEHVRHPRLDCVVLLALAMLCCNAPAVTDTFTDTLPHEVAVTNLRVPILFVLGLGIE